MNIIETSIPIMEKIRSQLEEKVDLINSMLKELGLSTISVKSSVEKIQKQIDSANNKFTIAFVGTFKTGKSTIINSLLQLEGSKRLSSEFDPDTAKCIRLIKKERGQDFEAEIIFQDDAYPVERMSWEEAKKYTSQVALDKEGESFKEKAAMIEEVRYYVNCEGNSFLDLCNILDLPGTGTGLHLDHTAVTDRKIMESDCIFWVVSTLDEPDKESIKNLEKVSTKMLPIINVFQYEAEDISSEITPEEIKDILTEQYQAYLADAEDPVIYYGKEIDMAQQQGREVNDEWGKSAFFYKVTEILQNAQKGDRMTRIRRNLNDALSECDAIICQLKDSDAMTQYLQSQQNDRREAAALLAKLSKCHAVVDTDIRTEAKKAANEIIESLISAADAFISHTMSGINIKALRRKSFEEKLRKDFEDNYARLESGWISGITNEFAGSVKDIIIGSYSDFSLDMEKELTFSDMNTSDIFQGNFINSMTKVIAKDMAKRLAPTLISTIVGGVLLAIPGGALLELAGTAITAGINAISGISKDDKLFKLQESIKIQSRNEMRQQRIIISNELREEGVRVNAECDERITEEIEIRNKLADGNLNKMSELKRLIDSLRNDIEEYQVEVRKI